MTAGFSKRALAAKALGSAVARPFPRARSRELRILAYHRVLDDDPGSFQYDEGVISATTEVFERQVQFVAKNFDVISFKDLVQFELGTLPIPKWPLIITFDDGYRDNYTNAFPVMRRHALPATIFLAAEYIGKDRLFWWDLVAYCVKHSAATSVVLPDVSTVPVSLATAEDKRLVIGNILQWIKRVPDKAKNKLVDELPDLLHVTLPDLSKEPLQLTWDEVREMAAGGIEFGSHTMTHPILSNVGTDALEHEIAGSKRLIEQELGKEIVAFAYPVGGQRHFNCEAQVAVAQSGFRYAVSYINGVASMDDCLRTEAADTGNGRSDLLPGNRFSMPRIHVEAADPLSLFRANLNFPKIMLDRQPASDSDLQQLS